MTTSKDIIAKAIELMEKIDAQSAQKVGGCFKHLEAGHKLSPECQSIVNAHKQQPQALQQKKQPLPQFTLQDIEGQLSKLAFTPSNIRSEKIEYQTSLPYFMTSFNDFLRVNKRIPSQNEYIDNYLRTNGQYLSSLNLTPDDMEAVKARATRAYPSLIRDLHFTSLLQYEGYNPIYDEDADVNGGVDQIIDMYGTPVYIHCFTGTNRAMQDRERKEHRHNFNGVHIDLPLDMNGSNSKRIGNFIVYSDKAVRQLDGLIANAMRGQRR